MAYTFGDGFDLYALPQDAFVGYWDTGAVGGGITLTTGRFPGGRSLTLGNAFPVILMKNSPANDAVHHINFAFIYGGGAFSGTSINAYLQLLDGANSQCAICFRSDGAIVLQSTPNGTTLATYTAGMTVLNTFVAYEIEVVIHNTAGSFTVRKSGNTSNDFSATGLNTRNGSTNNYANRLQLGASSADFNQRIDDILWRSDAASVPWVGDIRCYTRMPATDVTNQFAPGGSVMVQSGSGGVSAYPVGANFDVYSIFSPTRSGFISSLQVSMNSGATGHIKAAIFNSSPTPQPQQPTPTTLLGTANVLTNPVAGWNTMTFPTPVPVTAGVTYVVGLNQDVSMSYITTFSSQTSITGTTAYATFPISSPPTAINGGNQRISCNMFYGGNAIQVSELQQDGISTYAYDANVGDADFYTLAAAAGTPATVVAVTTRGFVEKSDAGARSAAVQLKSGSSTVQSTPAPLNSSFTWMYRTDTVDPATGAAWTPTAVNAVQIGPIVTA